MVKITHQKETFKENRSSEKNNDTGKTFDSTILMILGALAMCTILYMWDIIFSSGMLPGHPSDLIEPPVLSQINSIINYHQFPLWNNLWTTGFPEYASPISALYNPLVTIPYLIFGVLTGVKVIVVLHVFLAGICFWLFSTTVTANRSLQLYGSILFMLSGSLAGRIDAGHTELMTTQIFIPLTMYLMVKAYELKDVKYIIASAISMAMFVFGGAIYYFVFFVVLFAIYSAMRIFDKGRSSGKRYSIPDLKVMISIFTLCLMFSSIKLIPALMVSDHIVRIDPIDPFTGSGLFRDLITSFATGNALSGYSIYESYAYLGLIPFIFAILSVFNRTRDRLYLYPPLIAFFIWASGNNTFTGYIHLLPLLDGFRVPGRTLLFASFIVIILSIYGLEWFLNSFDNNKEKVKPILYLLAVVIFFELQEITLDLIRNYSSDPEIEIIGVGLVVAVVVMLMMKNAVWDRTTRNLAVILIVFSVLAVSSANIQYINPYENIMENETSIALATGIKAYDANEHEQIWLVTDGWPYHHMDVAYNSMTEDMHMQRAYYGYFLKDMPSSISVGDTIYHTANYLIHTQYLETGESMDIQSILTVNGVSVHQINNSLPNVFAVRNGEIISLPIKYFSPNKVVADGTDVRSGDVVLFKNAYYKGWKVNGDDAQNIGNMVGYEIIIHEDEIIFTFEPFDFKVGLGISLLSLLSFAVLLMRREKINVFLKKT
ncbi:MAG: hypothetical protein ACXQTE_04540 [Methanosarcinaceae archaeon]